ncbi:MAG: uncharacterized protein PWP64_1480 [Candidatus Cloacimonadota bacterium]|nr:uncharacterized protein [Candidatus Cloacimonadota bacterium]
MSSSCQSRSYIALILHSAVILLCGIMLGSCAAGIHSPRVAKSLDEALITRDLDAALAIVENPKYYKAKERLLYYLDAGVLYHYKGDWAKSNELLDLAEDAIVELYTKSVARAGASMLINDNMLEYSGEDYEDVYINVFKALNYLKLGDTEAAFVEIRKVDDKLSYLEQKYAQIAKEMSKNEEAKIEIKAGKNRFHSSALARYLSMTLYDAAQQKDDARIDYDNILFAFRSQPEIYPFSPPDIIHPQTAKAGNVVRVLSFVNRGPYKKARELHIHTSEDMLLIGSVDDDVLLDAIPWKGIKEGYYFKFAVPYLQQRQARIAFVEAVTQDGKRYRLQKLEDLNQVAVQSYEIKEPLILLKSVTRTVLKGLAAEEAKAQAEKRSSSLAASLISLATDATVYFSESADLRLSQFFPQAALIAEIPLPEGEHKIRLEYFSQQGNMLYAEEHPIRVSRNKPNLISSWCF